jgi:LemA protein
MDPSYILGAAIAIAALLVIVIAIYNGLVGRRMRVRNAWAEIDVQLKRRHDLIPNLVETARGYMQHERETLEWVTQARLQAMASGDNVAARSAAEGTLTAALGQLFAAVERYPALRAAENMTLLQEQLTSTENRIAYARQCYNDSVMEYNTAVATFPRNLIAGPLGFSAATLFAADDTDRVNTAVKF